MSNRNRKNERIKNKHKLDTEISEKYFSFGQTNQQTNKQHFSNKKLRMRERDKRHTQRHNVIVVFFATLNNVKYIFFFVKFDTEFFWGIFHQISE